MFLKRAMRYYRVWIYCCNMALLLATAVFVILLIWFLSDMHMSLLPSISLIHPSFLYAFFALILQGGMVQTIGCLGAVRMNEKLLTIYWNLLVILLFGDAVVGVIWLFRYNILVTNLRSDLKIKLNNEYGFHTSFEQVWDRIQREFSCCGVDGPFDFNSTLWIKQVKSQLVPRSCCRPLDPSESLNLPASGLAAGASSTTLSPSQQGLQQNTKSPSQSMALQSASLQPISTLPSGVTFKKPFTAGHRKKRSSEYTHQDEWSHNAGLSTPPPPSPYDSHSSSLISATTTKSININATQDKYNLNHDSLTFREQRYGYGNYLAKSNISDDTTSRLDMSDSGHKKHSADRTRTRETGCTRHRHQSLSSSVKGLKWLPNPSHHYYYHHKLPHQNVQQKEEEAEEEQTELTKGPMQLQTSSSPHSLTSHRGLTGDTFTTDQLLADSESQLFRLPHHTRAKDSGFNSPKYLLHSRPAERATENLFENPFKPPSLHEASVNQGHNHHHHHRDSHQHHRHCHQFHGKDGKGKVQKIPHPSSVGDASFIPKNDLRSEDGDNSGEGDSESGFMGKKRNQWQWPGKTDEATGFDDTRQMQLKTSHLALSENEVISSHDYGASAIKSDIQGEESAKISSERIWSANGDIFDANCVSTYSHESIHVYGCYDSIFKWIQRTTDTLCVLGFCVISFLKVCFACILRYEIKEMIQKIQSLKAGSSPGASNRADRGAVVNSSPLAPGTASRNHSSAGAGHFAQDLEGSFPSRGSVHQVTKEKTLPSSSFSLDFGASCTSAGHQHQHQQNSFAVSSGHEGLIHQQQHRRSLSGQSAGRRSSTISVTEKSSSSTDAAQLQPASAALNCIPSSTTSAGQSQLSWQVGHSAHHQNNHQSNNTHQHHRERQTSPPQHPHPHPQHPHGSLSHSQSQTQSSTRLVSLHRASGLVTQSRANSLSGADVASWLPRPGHESTCGPTSAPTKTASNKRPQATTITTTATVNPCVS